MIALIKRIWEQGEGNFVWLPHRTNQVWIEGAPIDLDTPGELTDAMLTERGDQYFTPLCFVFPTRINAGVDFCGVLYADIDGGHAPEYILPTILWQTSPGCTQAVWFLRDTIPRALFEELNRDLTYFIGADRGGWHASKVLRVPGTLNWKRATETADGMLVPRGVLIHDDGPTYDYKELRGAVPRQSSVHSGPTTVPYPERVFDDEWRKLLVKQWPNLPMSVRSWLFFTTACEDRSRLVWRCAYTMAAAGIPRGITFQLIDGTAWNKYKDRPQTLWGTVNKAYDAFTSHLENEVPYPPMSG